MRSFRLAVLLTFAALLVSLAPAQAAQGAATQTFCVSGTSNGVGWSWGIVSNGGLRGRAVVKPLPAGAGCAAFARAFVGSVNSVPLSGCTAKVSANNPCCFTITCEEGFDFWIGDANGDPAGDSCKVTDSPDGCSFNPIIFFTKNPAVIP